MSVQCGIVGLPNVGKSTIFNALTNAGAQAANYPFCTIEPNTGVVAVPDLRLEQICAIVKPQAQIPTTMEFVDIAGLVKNASQGEGLGNQFLGHIRDVDALVHVVRCFDHPDVVHVHGKVDPVYDAEIINTELLLCDLDQIDRRLDRTQKLAKSGNKEAIQDVEYLQVLQTDLRAGKPARVSNVPHESRVWTELRLLTGKPMLYVANVAETDADRGNAAVEALRAHAITEKAQLVILSGALEAEIATLDAADRVAFLADAGLKEPGLNRLARAGYELLDLVTYFTAGEKEVRAWTIHRGMTAPQAAGVIHSDFERGFIRAEVYHLDDLLAAGSEANVKAAGKMRLEGKEYIVKDGDMIFFRFNV